MAAERGTPRSLPDTHERPRNQQGLNFWRFSRKLARMRAGFSAGTRLRRGHYINRLQEAPVGHIAAEVGLDCAPASGARSVAGKSWGHF